MEHLLWKVSRTQRMDRCSLYLHKTYHVQGLIGLTSQDSHLDFYTFSILYIDIFHVSLFSGNSRMGSQGVYHWAFFYFLHLHIEFPSDLDSPKEFCFEESIPWEWLAFWLLPRLLLGLATLLPSYVTINSQKMYSFGFYKGVFSCELLVQRVCFLGPWGNLSGVGNLHGSNDLQFLVFSNLEIIRLFIPALVFNIIFPLVIFSFGFISFIVFFNWVPQIIFPRPLNIFNNSQLLLLKSLPLNACVYANVRKK